MSACVSDLYCSGDSSREYSPLSARDDMAMVRAGLVEIGEPGGRRSDGRGDRLSTTFTGCHNNVRRYFRGLLQVRKMPRNGAG